jgi:hypothetical protein
VAIPVLLDTVAIPVPLLELLDTLVIQVLVIVAIVAQDT